LTGTNRELSFKGTDVPALINKNWHNLIWLRQGSASLSQKNDLACKKVSDFIGEDLRRKFEATVARNKSKKRWNYD